MNAYGGVSHYRKVGGVPKGSISAMQAKIFSSFGQNSRSIAFTSPQYNTWIELQYDQNEKDILKYADDIVKNGFPVGVIMIDDNWQDRYGTWNFDCEKFSDPKGMIKKLTSHGL